MGEHCEIWMTGLAAETSADVALLNPVELTRRDGYVFAADRSRFTLGVALSRRLAGRMLGLSPTHVPLDRTCARCGAPHGKPALPGTGLHLSVSHSADLVAVAATTAGPVGLDVERIEPVDPLERIKSDESIDPLDPLAHDADFFRTWCRTEAVVKATGDGLRVEPGTVVVSAPHEPPRLLAYPRAIAALQLTDLDLEPGYAAALAVLTPEAVDVTVRRFESAQ